MKIPWVVISLAFVCAVACTSGDDSASSDSGVADAANDEVQDPDDDYHASTTTTTEPPTSTGASTTTTTDFPETTTTTTHPDTTTTTIATTTSTSTTPPTTTTSTSPGTTTTTIVTTTSTTTTTGSGELTPGFVFIPSGSFIMGSPTDEPGRHSDETQHQVTLTNDFEMSIYETTQVEFTTLIGWNPSYFGPSEAGADCGDNCPVEYVSWYDAVAYANEFSLDAGWSPCYVITDVTCTDGTNVGTDLMDCMNSAQKGIESAAVNLNGVSSVYDCDGYRLPTEAEWEYAARAGTDTAFYNGEIANLSCEPLDPNMDAIGWYCGNGSDTTEMVGQKVANGWGLYDMSGNVWEWTWDWWSAYPPSPATDPEGAAYHWYRVFRGGGWVDGARDCRSANRYADDPRFRYDRVGLRLSRSLP